MLVVVTVGVATTVAVWLGGMVVHAMNRPDRAQPVATPGKVLAGDPQRLVIPALGVDAEMVPLGLNAHGELDAPVRTDAVGWYRDGPEPGQAGTVVVAGHLDTTTGPAVFAELPKARAGDRLQFKARDTTVTYEIERVAKYPKAAIPNDEVYRPTSGHDLRLITCGGTFDRRTRHYRDNVVVYARQV